MKMSTSVNVHLETSTAITVRRGEKYTAVCLDYMNTLFFVSDEHLRSFAESILQQLEKKEGVSAS